MVARDGIEPLARGLARQTKLRQRSLGSQTSGGSGPTGAEPGWPATSRAPFPDMRPANGRKQKMASDPLGIRY